MAENVVFVCPAKAGVFSGTCTPHDSFKHVSLARDNVFPGKFDPIGQLDENFGVRELGARSNVIIASSFVVISWRGSCGRTLRFSCGRLRGTLYTSPAFMNTRTTRSRGNGHGEWRR
jgi:hypothetical protein